MTTKAILQADVIDIIFEHRNKNYGAYTLRKFYNNRLYKAMGLTMLIVCLLLTFTLFKKEASKLINTEVFDIQKSLPPVMPEKPKDPKQPQQTVAAPSKAPMQKAGTTVAIVPDVNADPIVDLKDNVALGNENRPGDVNAPAIFTAPPGTTPGTAPEAPAVPPPVDRITPSNTAEVMPAYPGGMEALRKFLQKNLGNPADVEDGQIVSVKIRFIVGYDGVLKGFQTIEDGGAAFNNEVIRVLKKMPQWIPGKTRGENVSVYYTIPVKFTPYE